jgi:hypothetical protein
MNNELDSKQNEVSLFHFLALFRRGNGEGEETDENHNKSLVKTLGFMTDTELLKAWINTT